MRRLVIAFAALSCLSSQGAAQTAIPERREVVTKDVDFYGADLQPLFDTTLQACQRSCLSDPSCKAYTFNSRSNACFPKSDVTDVQPYEGAVSARILDADTQALTRAKTHAADLAFLTQDDLKQAHDDARGISGRHPAGQWGLKALLEAVQSRQAEGDALNAMRWTGAAVAQADTSDLWAEYARLLLAVKTKSSSDRRRYANWAQAAAINAYLRAPSDPARVSALQILADSLERHKRGRDMIPALRLAQSIQPRDDIQLTLESAVAKYGFRITEHRADNESKAPRICAEFSEPLVKAGVDYTPYVRLPDTGLVVQAEDRQICIDGVQHGAHYRVTFRQGLPAASGESLIKDVELALYVRDRSPQVSFPGRAYVLPRAADAALPIETVNLDTVDLSLRRISDRNLLRAIQDNYFARPLSHYAEQDFASNIAEDIWSGTGEVQNALNQNMTTRLPMGDVLADQKPGIYALTAKAPDTNPYDDAGATQWFVLTDLGLTTMQGTDGLHIFARGLSDADALAGIELTLLSRANRELGTTTTDPEGHALFAPGLTRGNGAAAPALLIARQGDQDIAFLSLTDPAFDLSDRGVEGRPPAPPVDVFLTTDRGAYRAGEVIHVTALARDTQMQAITDLPLTSILIRPDGVEYSRHVSTNGIAGGHAFSLPVSTSAPRGTWQLAIKADPDAPALAQTSLLVEDFLPERIDFDLALPEASIRPGDTSTLTVEARYLFGAPGGGLKADGTLRLLPLRRHKGYPGYHFGEYDLHVPPEASHIDGGTTGDDGRLVLPVKLPKTKTADRPYEAQITLRVNEGSGRPVERQLIRALAPAGPMIGLKPEFTDVVPEGGGAAFQIIAIDGTLKPTAMQVRWTMNRVETRYQWYQQYGNWNWEPITTRQRIATGDLTLDEDPVTVSAPVTWGHYELLVERLDGTYVASSTDFYAGWYAPADATSTPDTLDLSLDQPSYSPGDTAQLRIVPRYAGTALIAVMSNQVIARQVIEVTAGDNLIPVDVTDDWGTGAYVTAQLVRPMDISAGQNPARALGLAYAKVEPRDKQLTVEIGAPDSAEPRSSLSTTIKVQGLTEGDTAHVTLAAIDLGILNLTGFDSPDPSAHYFGQRRLGVEMRDLYGRLIDGMNGAAGQIRSGGDAGNGLQRQAPPPTEKLIAFFSGPAIIGPDGTAAINFDMPDFNGTVRLMAVAWSNKAVGQASRDVLVRDPIVVTASLPRFLAPGDQSRLLLELTHTEGPIGRVGLDITAKGITLEGDIPSGLDLAKGETATLTLPLRAKYVGDHSLRIALTTPDGKQLTKDLTLAVRANDPVISSTQRFSLAAGATFKLDQEIFTGLRPNGAEVLMSAGPMAKLNTPGLLRALDRYPYGCTEQITSQALPLLYFGPVAEALGLGNQTQVAEKIDQAVDLILTRQASNGAFGLWRAASGDFWLDAYVADFLSRAKAQGYEVPNQAFAMAMDNLRNRVNYAPDFDFGGEDIAYALMVLAGEGAARIGDLRYYADVKAEAFATPLALAQLGHALASYGDQTRADRMFTAAAQRLEEENPKGSRYWRVDYGTPKRDSAAVLTLAVEAGSTAVDTDALSVLAATTGPESSTQEQVWTLLATNALLNDPAQSSLALNGEAISGPLVRRMDAATLGTQTLTNTDGQPTDITLTTFGVPEVPAEASGYGYQITRTYFDMDGNDIQPDQLETGTRMVVVVTVTPAESGSARLMIDDPLPAGLEIDNPNLLRAGDIRALDWLNPAPTRFSEARSDRFLAAVDRQDETQFQLAYIVRAVTPGTYHYPAATVEDMYRPQYRANTATTQLTVTK
ncbi:alpha-2-macroglobulin family protein [Roseovarius sp. EL26]|uniref:alpha-2-macroglobulin family protein n=1 Tax=Roseovarius sp. EL26 TaxID=2126672 RepID=UPI000EA08FC2|nr:alpha-2-macroglobulin family protein [Roseovarius sp. EL26]